MLQSKFDDHERGATLVMVALSVVAIITMSGLLIDGGRAYALRRQMQNAADAAALDGARQLNKYITAATTDKYSIYNTAKARATGNGASASPFTCRLTAVDRTDLGPCPDTVTNSSATIPSNAYGVKVTASQTEGTFLIRITGQSSYSSNASATAQVGKPLGGRSPFMLCSTVGQGSSPSILQPQGNNTYTINPAAIGQTYAIWGNQIKKFDCGDGSSSFRGLADGSKSFSVPGWWGVDTGNKNGPVLKLINSGKACTGDPTVGCELVVPLCAYGNNSPGKNFELYCVDFGLFRVESYGNNAMTGTFLGRAELTGTTGGIGGAPDPNGARVVQLTD